MGLSDSYKDLDYKDDDLDVSSRSVFSAISTSTDNQQSPLAKESRTEAITCTVRLTLLLSLVIVGAVSAFVAFYLMGHEEDNLAELQFEATAERASAMAVQILKRKRMGLVSLSSIISGANPDVTAWPRVHLPNFEVISNNLMKTADEYHMGFAPLVTPEQVTSFEDHAYSYYENNRSPEPFPEGTGQSPFGKGVYAVDSTTKQRYHDTTGETDWNSPNTILAPLLHHSEGPDSTLLSNLHADQSMGQMIDAMIQCSKQQKNLFERNTTKTSIDLDKCTILSGVSPDTAGWTPDSKLEPWGLFIHPVCSQRSPDTLSGLVLTSLSWKEIFNGVFANSVSGIYAVLEATDGSSHTYMIQEGEAVLLGKGDAHDTEYDDFRLEVELTSQNSGSHHYFGELSVSYTLVLYPSDQFFDSFATANPFLSSIGAIMVLVITSGLFVLYDTVVRREYFVKKDLLEAKRKFIRFVSHEVRTPLNSVHMGLTVLRGELEAKYGGGSLDDDATVDTFTSRKPIMAKTDKQLVAMADEIAMNCNGAVDILNDFINFDKIETDNLTLELSVVRLFDQVESTCKEFKMVAKNNKIKLKISTPLTRTNKAPKESFTVGDSLRITHVFRNLIANALETTPDYGTVEVKATWHANSMKNAKNKDKHFVLKDGKKMKVNHNGYMKYVVSDTGKGMTQAQIRRLLHKGVEFNVNKLQPGNASGLGLWVAKGIVMRHRGTLTAHSPGLGKGSIFTVSLPTYDIDDPTPPKTKATHGSNAAKDVLGVLKVLVVDDAKMNLKLLMRLVSKRGHKVDGAEDGAIAVDMASKAMEESSEYDVILMDYQMPVMDGPTATRILRSKGCDAFICGVTGNVMQEDIKYFKKCGANEVLHKPAKIKALEDLWIEYGVRGEFPPDEGAHDEIAQKEKPKRVQLKSNFDGDGDVSLLSLSSNSLGNALTNSSGSLGNALANSNQQLSDVGSSTRVNMTGNVLDGSETSRTPDFPSSRKTAATVDSSGDTFDSLWTSLKSPISETDAD